MSETNSASTQLPGAGRRFLNGLLPENPTLRQLLGMCPTLAVTNTLAGAVTMAGATTFVLVMSNCVTSLLRNLIKPHMRILVYTLTIAAFVTIADRFLAAFLPTMSEKLGPYVPLIVVNCIIISRAEICASRQGPGVAIADALGMGGGFLLTLSAMGVIREVIGFGTLFGLRVLPEQVTVGGVVMWKAWTIMILPPGAFLTLGVLIGVVNWVQMKKKARQSGGQ
ncbi:MAG: Electron transport complex subunit RnfE [Phycisphaerae bacterium]|nr:Electron transport complex subunit RnfE [Phycisphaerae bacterium]